MKKFIFALPFLFIFCAKGQSQSAEIYVCLGEDSYESIRANSLTISDDGSEILLSGNVSVTSISNPDPEVDEFMKPKCGGNTGWVCGTAHITTNGDVTTVQCQGSSGRCVKVVSAE